MQWISCKDKMPNRLQEVLFHATNGPHSRDIMTGYHRDGIWYCTYLFYGCDSLINDVIVTHWMALPDYPTLKPNEETIID